MNYASNDEIFQEILDIEKLGDGTLNAEQKYRIALHDDPCIPPRREHRIH
jgi:hypothetical protein